MEEKTVYIHYGSKSFDKSKFKNPKNIPYRNKPSGGFWASPIDAKYGWIDWNEDSEYEELTKENSFTFVLKEQARVYHIRNRGDYFRIPKLTSPLGDEDYRLPDFEKIAKYYDAIELHFSEDENLYWTVYGWDCDSILILNPDIIEECAE